MTRDLKQLEVLVGEWTGVSAKFSGVRASMSQWEKSTDGKRWEVDFDLSYAKTGD